MRMVKYKVTFDISLYYETRIKCSITNCLNMVSAEASFTKSRFLTSAIIRKEKAASY